MSKKAKSSSGGEGVEESPALATYAPGEARTVSAEANEVLLYYIINSIKYHRKVRVPVRQKLSAAVQLSQYHYAIL